MGAIDGIVREMENAVFRTGFSTIVRESHDFSCGLMDATGRLVAHASRRAYHAPHTVTSLSPLGRGLV